MRCNEHLEALTVERLVTKDRRRCGLTWLPLSRSTALRCACLPGASITCDGIDMTDTMLNYDRAIRPQTTYWSCGPGSAEVVLNGLGKRITERQLIADIGTDTEGTDYVGLIESRALNKHDPAGKWASVYLERDPATPAQIEQFWKHAVQSVRQNGRGMVLNWVVPPWNRPKPVPPSLMALAYPNAMTWHYVALMGINDDDPKRRRCWIADPGFAPGGMWCSLEQSVQLIVPKGYTYSAATTIAPQPPSPPPPPNPSLAPAAITQAQWVAVWRTHTEWRAIAYGDPTAVNELVVAARNGDESARTALARLEQVNPTALQSYLTKG